MDWLLIQMHMDLLPVFLFSSIAVIDLAWLLFGSSCFSEVVALVWWMCVHIVISAFQAGTIVWRSFTIQSQSIVIWVT